MCAADPFEGIAREGHIFIDLPQESITPKTIEKNDGNYLGL